MRSSNLTKTVDLEELVTQALISRRVTLDARRQLMQVFLQSTPNETDLMLVDRLLYGVRRGILSVVRV